MGMALPVLKVLVSEEGLHGWAWTSMSTDRLGATVVQRNLTEAIPIPTASGTPVLVTSVVDLVDVHTDSPASRAGIEANAYLIGVVSADPNQLVQTGPQLLRDISLAPHGEPMTLRVYHQDNVRDVAVELRPAGFASGILGSVAGAIPEPKTRTERLPILIGLLIIVVGMTVIRDLFRFFQESLQVCPKMQHFQYVHKASALLVFFQ